MPDEKTSSNQTLTVVMGVLVTICISLSGFALKWTFEANAEIKVMQVQNEQIKEAIGDLSKKSELDKKQDGQLSKHWKLHSWSKREIDAMRFKDGNGPSEWPDLGGPSDWE